MSKRTVNDPSLHGWIDDNGKWVWDGTDGSAGAGMIVSETEPTDPVTGMQWLNALTGEVFIYDDGKWLEMPGGKDGAAGADGNIADGAVDQEGVVATWDDTAGQWTPDSSLTIDATGNVGIKRGSTIGAGKGYADDQVSAGSGHIAPYDPSTGALVIDAFAAPYLADSGIHFRLDGTEAMRIDASGNATFSGLVNARTFLATFGGANPVAGFATSASDASETPAVIPAVLSGAVDASIDFGRPSFSGLPAFRWKDAHFSGTVYANGSPLTRTVDLIKTLSTLRQATMDETQDIRESLRSAIDELVEGFEQEISTMEESE